MAEIGKTRTNGLRETEDRSDLRAVLVALSRRRRLILGCFLLFLAAAAAFSFLAAKQYTASAALLFRDPGFDQQIFGNASGAFSVDEARQASTNVTLASLDVVAANTARNLAPEVTEKRVRQETSVGAVGDSDVVKIEVTDRSSQLAARIANTYAREFIDFRRRADRAKIQGAVALVDERIASLSPGERAGTDGRELVRRGNQLRILASLQTGNAELVQPALVPRTASIPRTKLNLALGAVLGLLVGAILALLAERLDRRVRDVDTVEEVLQLPLLTVVPDETVNGGLVTDPAADSLRMLYANVRYFNVDRDIGSLLVTSSEAEEGKTTIALSLAGIAASVRGPESRVLLLDADMRKTRVADRTGLRGQPGLSELLSGSVSLEQAIQSTEDARLGPDPGVGSFDVIVGGGSPPNPTALLESRRMADLMATLRERYDLIIVDTVPLGLVSDAVPLIRLVDGVVVVAAIGRAHRHHLRALRVQLENLRAPTLGAVVNRARVSRGRYAYGYN